MLNQFWLEEQLSNPSIKERDKDLIKRAKETIDNNIFIGEDARWKGLRGISPSREKFLGLWNWDSAFHAYTVSRWDTDLAEEQLKIFLGLQLESGMYPDVLFFDGTIVERFTKPPVFPWACVQVYKRSGNKSFLKEAYESYKKNEAWWCKCRRGREEKLFHYDCEEPGSEEARSLIGCESGWDNAVRWDEWPSDLWAIDLNCFMVMFYEAMAVIADALCLAEEAALWRQKYDELKNLVNGVLYDEEKGYYADVNRFSGKHATVLTPASFMPLYCGIAPKEYAGRMNQVALKHFMPGMPTVAYTDSNYTEDQYWRGPTWLNVAYFAAKGLKDYGYIETAETIKETILDWCSKNDTFYENYNSKTGEGLWGGQFSWSSTFVIEFILNF